MFRQKITNPAVKYDTTKKYRIHFIDGTTDEIRTISKKDAIISLCERRKFQNKTTKYCMVTEC